MGLVIKKKRMPLGCLDALWQETRILLMGMKSGECFGVGARDLFYFPSHCQFQWPSTVVRSKVPESNSLGPNPVQILPV